MPFTALHVDTGKKFSEMYAFRDRIARNHAGEIDIALAQPIAQTAKPPDNAELTLDTSARSVDEGTDEIERMLARTGIPLR